jgi:CBS-domain-containing membrane protein
VYTNHAERDSRPGCWLGGWLLGAVLGNRGMRLLAATLLAFIATLVLFGVAQLFMVSLVLSPPAGAVASGAGAGKIK